MAKAVLISIRPKWVEKILSGEKTLELRKAKPKLETPFKVYIYCTNQKNTILWNARSYIYVDDHNHNAFDRCWNGSVVAEFTCDCIDEYDDDTISSYQHEDYARWNDFDLDRACMHPEDFQNYANGKWLYGWHISDLKIYDQPKPLSAFKGPCKIKVGCWECPYFNYTTGDCDGRTIKRPPQSWCYVEAMDGERKDGGDG